MLFLTYHSWTGLEKVMASKVMNATRNPANVKVHPGMIIVQSCSTLRKIY